MAGYDPPAFFKQGPAPLALLVFYVASALALMILDKRFHYLETTRQAISVVTHPLQLVAHMPAQAASGVARYFNDLAALQGDLDAAMNEKLADAPRLQRLAELEAENEKLRRLLSMRSRFPANATSARILYASRDPFSRRIVIDQGMQQDVAAGQPVIDEIGVIGQVTRVFPFVSEVALLTDKEQAVPVKIVRNGLRSVSFGLGNGKVELRFLPVNADVQIGDIVVTSGLDEIYHAGFPVARVDKIERDASYAFARVFCSPLAGVENGGAVLLLKPHPPEPTIPREIEATSPQRAAADKRLPKPKRTAKP